MNSKGSNLRIFILLILFTLLVTPISFAYEKATAFTMGDLIELGTYNDKPILWHVTSIDSSGKISVV